MTVRFFFLLCFFLCAASLTNAQFLAAFSAIQHNEKVELDITIAGGNTCNGINILRSSDAVNFSSIGGIAGICGSSTEDVYYSFTDPDPIRNATNYYRLDLITLGYSIIIDLHFVYFGEDKILFYPNPFVDRATVYLKGTNADVSSYRINDSNGKILKQEEGIRGNYFEIKREDLPSGLYYLEINTGNRVPVLKPFIIY